MSLAVTVVVVLVNPTRCILNENWGVAPDGIFTGIEAEVVIVQPGGADVNWGTDTGGPLQI